MDKKKQPNRSGVLLVVLLAVVAAIIAVFMICPILAEDAGTQPGQTGPAATQPAETEPGQTRPAEESQPAASVPDQVEYNLGYGLCITDSGRYTGMYMEDGSNEVVSDVMMLVVFNGGEKDVQLAEITALCGGEEYHFTLTNLAVGERAVLLEQERRPSAELISAVLDTYAPFGEPMSLYGDTIQVSGLDGMLNVKNISDGDITGDICVYYKYAAQDIFYGGITFRIRIEGGLKAGEIRQVPAGHYTADGCAIVQVTIYE